MDLRKKLILNSYVESFDSRNQIIIDDKKYIITDRLRKKLKFRKSIVVVETLVLASLFKLALNKGLATILPNKFIGSLLFLLVGFCLVLFTSSLIFNKGIEDDLFLMD